MVQVFQKTGNNWRQIGESITPIGLNESNELRFWSGFSVSLSGDGTTVAVGSPGDYYTWSDAKKPGSTSVYKLQTSTFAKTDYTDLEGYGQKVGGNWFLMYYPSNTRSWTLWNGMTPEQQATNTRLYFETDSYNTHITEAEYNALPEEHSETWTQIGQTLVGRENNDFFGRNVKINQSGTILAVGAPYYGSQGYARVYEYESNTWKQIGEDITARDTQTRSHWMGHSLSMNSDGSLILVGAPYYSLNGGGSREGLSRVYQIEDGQLTQTGKDIVEDINLKMGYSNAMSSDGKVIASALPHFNATDQGREGLIKIYKWPLLDNLY